MKLLQWTVVLDPVDRGMGHFVLHVWAENARNALEKACDEIECGINDDCYHATIFFGWHHEIVQY